MGEGKKSAAAVVAVVNDPATRRKKNPGDA